MHKNYFSLVSFWIMVPPGPSKKINLCLSYHLNTIWNSLLYSHYFTIYNSTTKHHASSALTSEFVRVVSASSHPIFALFFWSLKSSMVFIQWKKKSFKISLCFYCIFPSMLLMDMFKGGQVIDLSCFATWFRTWLVVILTLSHCLKIS